MKVTLVLLFFSFALTGLSQSVKELLQLVDKTYQSYPVFSLQSSYNLYKGDTREVKENYDGEIIKNKNDFYQRVNTTSFVMTPTFNLQISPSEKAILLFKQTISSLPIINTLDLLNQCSDTKLRSSVKYFYIDFYFQTKLSEFEKVVFKIHRNSNRISQIDYYYDTEINFSKDPKKKEFDKPHLKILFSNFNSSPSIESNLFNLESYVAQQNGKYVGSGAYKHYTILTH